MRINSSKHVFLLLAVLANSLQLLAQPDPSTRLWYTHPAEKWEDALPIGNGRLGGMYFGNVAEDRLQINEDTYWTGGPYSTVKKGGYQHLPEIQRLLFEGKPVEAHRLFGRYLLGNPVEQQKYQSLGNLILDFGKGTTVTEYYRELDLYNAVTKIRYKQDGVTYTREIFASWPAQAIVMRISADQPGKISFNAQLQGVRNQTHSNYATDYFAMDVLGSDGLQLTGKSADYLGVPGKLHYTARLKSRNKGGRVYTKVNTLYVEQADEVVLVLAAATNFINYRDISGNASAKVDAAMQYCSSRSYTQLQGEHIDDFRALFGRVRIQLPKTAQSALPTDERMAKVKEGPDPALAALGYQFGRYIMISSSRPGTQASNLQGIWNNDQNPWWDSKYTTNINTEMNYWNVDAGNLSECAGPLFDLIREVSDQGRQVAKEHYGVEQGWVFHQNTDIWRVAAPMDGSNWGAFTTGGAWLCTHIWEHFQYTSDTAFLRKNYPLMKGAAQFFLKFLVKDPHKGWLVTNPSTSPENAPGSPGNGRFFDEMNGAYYEGSQLCYGSTIDIQILSDLFRYTAAASELLHTDPEFRKQVLDTRSRLAPMQVGKDGSLQEWVEDWPQTEKNHRHFSHLYGLYPGHVLSPVKTPELVEPMKQVLEQRGDGAAGWSRVWKMCAWARLQDGNRANRIFKGYIQDQCTKSFFGKCYAAMQVDAAFGLEAAVMEMLVQSHEGYIELLPALPDEWKEWGSLQGVVVRGGFVLNFVWAKGKLTGARILSKAGGTCRLKTAVPVHVALDGQPVTVKANGNGCIEWDTRKGGTYSISF